MVEHTIVLLSKLPETYTKNKKPYQIHEELESQRLERTPKDLKP